MHGLTKRIRLTLADEYEFLEQLKAYEQPWNIIPDQDLQRLENEVPLEHCPSLEVELCHPFLKENVQIIIPPDCAPTDLADVLTKGVEKIWPVIIYVIVDGVLNENVSVKTIIFSNNNFCFYYLLYIYCRI